MSADDAEKTTLRRRYDVESQRLTACDYTWLGRWRADILRPRRSRSMFRWARRLRQIARNCSRTAISWRRKPAYVVPADLMMYEIPILENIAVLQRCRRRHHHHHHLVVSGTWPIANLEKHTIKKNKEHIKHKTTKNTETADNYRITISTKLQQTSSTKCTNLLWYRPTRVRKLHWANSTETR